MLLCLLVGEVLWKEYLQYLFIYMYFFLFDWLVGGWVRNSGLLRLLDCQDVLDGSDNGVWIWESKFF